MTKQLVVKYVSAPPGTGKTRAAVEFMRRHIADGKAGKKVGVVFYVAPTITLILQTYEKLKARVEDTQRRNIKCVWSKDTKDPSTVSRIMHIMNGEDHKGAKHGTVVMLTHVTFVMLRDHPMFKHTTVIFDEARKWTDMVSRRMELNQNVKRLFNRLFESELVDDTSNILALRPKKIPYNQRVKKVKTHDGAKAYNALIDIYEGINPEEGFARKAVYMVQGPKFMVQITMPSNPFRGFKSVYVMSADFTNSQMYHLMRREGTEVQDHTTEFMNTYLKDGQPNDSYAAAEAAAFARYKHVVLVPLLIDKSMPSKSQLVNGIIMPEKKVDGLDDLMVSEKLRVRDIAEVAKILKGTSEVDATPAQKQVLRYLERNRARHDILEWQLIAANKIGSHWRDKYPCKTPGVMFINTKLSGADMDRYHELMEREMYDRLSTGRAEGNNRYRKSNLVVFLAANNPNPLMARLLNLLLKDQGYSTDQDYIVDKAIQCIGRGNVRMHDIKDKMMAIVSTEGLARKIQERMKGYPTVDMSYSTKMGDMMTFRASAMRLRAAKGHDTREKRKRTQEAMSRKREMMAKHATEIAQLNKQLNSVRVLKRRHAGTEREPEIQKRLQTLLAKKAKLLK